MPTKAWAVSPLPVGTRRTRLRSWLAGFDVVVAGDTTHVGGGEGGPGGYVGGAFASAEGSDHGLDSRISGGRVRGFGLPVAAGGLVEFLHRVHAQQSSASLLR